MQTYRPKVNCPYCGSIQVKRMPAQPNKYPRPSDPALLSDWQNGYDCKKCGSEFVIDEVEPKKEGGFFSTLFGLLILAAAVYGGYHFFFGEPSKKADTQPTTTQETASEPVANQELAPISTVSEPQEQVVTPAPASTVAINQDFPKDAEIAAHGYTPTAEDYKRAEQQKQQSIANSTDPSETLHISTTIRHNN